MTSQRDKEPSSLSIDLHTKLSLKSKTPFKRLRYIILALIAVEGFTIFYTNDMLSSLQTPLQKELNINMKQYLLINSAHSAINAIFQLFTGVTIIYVGDIYCNIVLVLIMCLSTTSMYISCLYYNLNIFFISKIIQGIANELLSLTIKVLVGRIFENYRISFVFSLLEASTRLGTSANNLISPLIYQYFKLLWVPFCIGTTFSLICLVCSIILIYLDTKLKNHLKNQSLEITLISSTEIEQQNTNTNSTNSINNNNKKKFDWRLLKQFNKWIMLLILIKCITNITLNNYLKMANDLLQQSYKLDYSTASIFLSIVYFIICLMTPFIGKQVDTKMNLFYSLRISLIILFLCYTLTSLLPLFNLVYYYAVIPFTLFLVFMSLQSAIIWPLYAILVGPQLLSIAMSLTSIISNLGQFFNPFAFSSIYTYFSHVDLSYAYPSGILYLAALIIPTIVLSYLIKSKNHRKNSTPKTQNV